jgi:hypothetical protein
MSRCGFAQTKAVVAACNHVCLQLAWAMLGAGRPASNVIQDIDPCTVLRVLCPRPRARLGAALGGLWRRRWSLFFA